MLRRHNTSFRRVRPPWRAPYFCVWLFVGFLRSPALAKLLSTLPFSGLSRNLPTTTGVKIITYLRRIQDLTCFHASFFPVCPLFWSPLFLPFSRHTFALFSPSKSALFCRVKGTAQSLERGTSGMDLSTKFGKEIPSRNLRKKRSETALRGVFCRST